MTTNPLLEKFRSSLSKINWKKLGIIILYVALGLAYAIILALLIGVVVVGHPVAPDHENLINALIMFVLFLGPGITIYTFKGGRGRKR